MDLSQFSMPAEWAPHQGTIITWPQKNGCSFPPPYDKDVHQTFVTFIAILSQVEEVHINFWDKEERCYIQSLLNKAPAELKNIYFHHHQSYEPWVRDHGPIFVCNKNSGERLVLNWKYNAWGGKYPPYDLDNTIPSKIATALGFKSTSIDMILEGGSIEVNGCGDLITTKSCLLNKNRNPEIPKAGIESTLKATLGIQAIHWLESGITGDDTDGHIDDLTRFVDPQTVVSVVENDPSDENYHVLQNNLKLLEGLSLDNGKKLDVIPLPMPSPVIVDGERLPASYANYYIANELVLLPTFDDPQDEVAVGILKQVFRNRRIVTVDARPLIWGLGSIHCLTQQIPASSIQS